MVCAPLAPFQRRHLGDATEFTVEVGSSREATSNTYSATTCPQQDLARGDSEPAGQPVEVESGVVPSEQVPPHLPILTNN